MIKSNTYAPLAFKAISDLAKTIHRKNDNFFESDLLLDFQLFDGPILKQGSLLFNGIQIRDRMFEDENELGKFVNFNFPLIIFCLKKKIVNNFL